VSPAFVGCEAPEEFRGRRGDSAAALALACNARPAETCARSTPLRAQRAASADLPTNQ
jgi:hypothetical protein